jgi:hypothetical protein
MSRRFLLNDLTPATRALYRAYRDAVRDRNKSGDDMDRARALQQVPATSLWHIDQDPSRYDDGVRERVAAQLADRTAACRRSEARWTAACARATEAFWAAVPAMEAEGYPRAWFNTPNGAVVIPAGQPSPGEHRPGRTSRVGGGDRVDITAGDECGGWGTVRQVVGEDYHVALYGSDHDIRVYTRSEIRKPRR